MRPMNAQWDPYRSDCSGFVSWAWDLPPPGRTTDELAPAVTDITQAIDGHALQPGDALNIPGDHMILFVSWITPGQSANFMEEPGCSSAITYAHAFTSDVEITGSSVAVDYEGGTFTAIRYLGITGDPDAGTVSVPDAGNSCFVTSLGLSGECLLTSECTAEGGTSTPGYCPGPTDIQCCTGLPAMNAGCTSNSECSVSRPVCNTATGQCRGCVSNAECAQGVCATYSLDPQVGRCVQCTTGSDCTATGVCNTATDTCVECTSDSECHDPAAPTCNTETHTCFCNASNTSCDQADAGVPPNAGAPADAGTAIVPDDRTSAGGCATGATGSLPVALSLLVLRRRRSIRT
jgi:hypothetical protein